MAHPDQGYFSATRHPWPCLLFLLPLLLGYEAGVACLGGAESEAIRNGADTWLRMSLQASGLPHAYVAPGLIVVVFLVWTWLRSGDRPDGVVGVCIGMVLESALLAFMLFKVSEALGPVLESFGTLMSLNEKEKLLRQVIPFVGAGIYEEVVFRLLLCCLLSFLFRLMFLPSELSAILTIITAALIFAAAHHVGTHGEKFEDRVFLFRVLAGLYFGVIYQCRGFGIAVGTHVAYDVLVGVLLAPS
jgi:membrane protease YdiL (CAAX protease family)